LTCKIKLLTGRETTTDCCGTNPARTDTHFLSPFKVTSGVKKGKLSHKPVSASREDRFDSACAIVAVIQAKRFYFQTIYKGVIKVNLFVFKRKCFGLC